VLAVRRDTTAAAALSATTTNTGTDKVSHGLAALAGRKVLATFVLGGGLLPQVLDRRRASRLADGVLASTCLTGSKGTSHRSCRETDRSNKSRLGTIRSLGLGVDSE
jgi:hypothetical protein